MDTPNIEIDKKSIILQLTPDLKLIWGMLEESVVSFSHTALDYQLSQEGIYAD